MGQGRERHPNSWPVAVRARLTDIRPAEMVAYMCRAAVACSLSHIQFFRYSDWGCKYYCDRYSASLWLPHSSVARNRPYRPCLDILWLTKGALTGRRSATPPAGLRKPAASSMVFNLCFLSASHAWFRAH
jgi:hypothetical protein